ncbi:MAG: segregation and condensation protein A [Fidelibacterota bacterium]
MYQIHLHQFEGPLDLLLYFIRRDEIDIYDIPIAKITADFLKTLNQMQHFNVRVAGEFVEMAATLIRIKSQMLLPRQDDLPEEQEDPRATLVQQLLEYQQYKQAAQELEQLAESRSHFFSRGKELEPPEGEDDPGLFLREVEIYDIARYFRIALENRPMIRPYDLDREPLNLEEQKAFVLAGFDGEGSCTFAALLRRLKTRLEIIVTFLALLELMRLKMVTAVQKGMFGEIILFRRDGLQD